MFSRFLYNRKVRYINKIIAVILIITQVMIFHGCKKSSDETMQSQYVERQCIVDEEIDGIIDITKLDDNNLELLGKKKISNGSKKEQLFCCSSNDKGKTWSKQEIDLSSLENNETINIGTINENGEMYFISQNTNECKLYNVNKDGKCNEINVDANLLFATQIKVSFDNQLYINENNNGLTKIVQIDLSSGKVKYNYDIGNDDKWNINKNKLIVSSSENITIFDTLNGKEEKKMDIGNLTKNKMMVSVINVDNDQVYFFTNEGVTNISVNNIKEKKLMNNKTTSFGNNMMDGEKIIKINKKEYLCVFKQQKNDNSDKLMHYELKENLVVNSNLSIYSLVYHQTIEQWVNEYQINNADVNVEYSYAFDNIREVDIAKKTDEINRLNTQIVSGNGPDIIITDDLPLNSYIEKGLLEDETDIVDKLDKDSLFMNVIEDTKVNNKYYSVPSLFNVKLILNEKASEIDSLEKLSSKIEEISNNSQNVLQTFTAEELTYLLYDSCGDKWIKDNKIDTNEIKQFLQYTKNIYDVTKDKHTKEKIDEHEKDEEEYVQTYGNKYSNYYLDTNNYSDQFSSKPNSIDIIEAYSSDEFIYLTSLKSKYGNVNYEIWKGQNGGKVIPKISLAINAKSKNKDIAKEFITNVFLDEYQGRNCFGISMNKNVVKKNINETISRKFVQSGQGDVYIRIDFDNCDEEDVNQIVDKLSSCGCVTGISKDVLELSIDSIVSYLEGKSNIDKTVENITKELNIYLNE